METLLDGNVLVALVLESHVNHKRAKSWFKSTRAAFATCAITQGTLLRVHMMTAVDRSAQSAWDTLGAITDHPRHVFWEESFGYQTVPFRHLQGPKQVTDAWLAELTRRRGGTLMTFDSGLVRLHKDVAEMVP